MSDPWLVLEVRGEMDLQVGPMLSDVGTHPCFVVFDLQRVTFMDCSSLGVLENIQRRAVGAGGSVRLASASAQVVRILTLTGMSLAFPQFDTLRAATSLPLSAAESAGDDRARQGHSSARRQ